jgi:hypothetical protein
MNSKKNEENARLTSDVASKRREFLRGMLRKALYVAPIVAVMSMSSVASAQGSPIMMGMP